MSSEHVLDLEYNIALLYLYGVYKLCVFAHNILIN